MANAEKSDPAAQNADTEIEELKARVEELTRALEAERARKDPALSREEVEELGGRVQEGFEQIEKQIDEHPVPSALAAFGIGLVLGLFLMR